MRDSNVALLLEDKEDTMPYNQGRLALLLISSLVVVGGCTSMNQNIHDETSGRAFFSSPQEAVPRIADMLRQSDFKTLATFYDLTDSDVPMADLESGDFFIREERPEFAHPGGFWRYKHPFAPGFEYVDMQSTDKNAVHVVRVAITIEQGAGSPDQVGYSFFYMIRSAHGWQVLPDTVEQSEEPTVID